MWTVSLLSALAPGAGHAQQAATEGSPTSAPSPDTGENDARQILEDPGTTAPAAQIAAIRLLASHDDTVKSEVVRLLNDGSPVAKVAVARSLAEVPWPDDQFINPLLEMLRSRDVAAASAAAEALTEYRNNPRVLQELCALAKSDRPDVQPAIIAALGSFAQEPAAQTLIDLVDEPDPIGISAIDALIAMTGRTDLDHNADEWKQWYAKNQNLSNANFEAEIVKERGQAFESNLGEHRLFETEVAGFLNSDFWSASLANRSSILLAYLRSPSPEIREIGAKLVYDSKIAVGALPGTMEQTRLLLSDPSAEVRAAAAEALEGDTNSTAQLVAQLARETDDYVRVKLINSLASSEDPSAVREMLTLAGKGSSMAVRIAAADGLSQAGDVVNKDPDLKSKAISTLKSALEGTDLPEERNLRRAIVGALAVIKDSSLVDVFQPLLSPNEDPAVRANALVGLGNMPDADRYAHLIASHLEDAEPTMRLAALRALHLPADSAIYIDPLVKLMNSDASDDVRREAWQDLSNWAKTPDADEQSLITLADDLSDPKKELVIRMQICERLKQDIQSATNGDARGKMAQQLAEQQQVVGDLLSKNGDPAGAAEQYVAALNFWKSNQGSPDVIRLLCKDIVDSLLASKQWDGAADFAAGIIKQFGNSPATQAIATEFIITGNTLDQSTDPDAYSDAIAMMDALQKMNPPLPQETRDQLANLRQAMEAKHNAVAHPQP
jgi:HEAT repeat protein